MKSRILCTKALRVPCLTVETTISKQPASTRNLFLRPPALTATTTSNRIPHSPCHIRSFHSSRSVRFPLSKYSKLFYYKSDRRKLLTPMCNYKMTKPKPEDSWPVPVIEAVEIELPTSHREINKFIKELISLGGLLCHLKGNGYRDDMTIAINHLKAKAMLETFGFSSSLNIMRISSLNGRIHELTAFPQKVIRDAVTEEPTVMHFITFKPGDKVKVLMPILFENQTKISVVKSNKGALHILHDRLWCTWEGGDKDVPKFFRIKCDHLGITNNYGESVKSSHVRLPEGLNFTYEQKFGICKIRSRHQLLHNLDSDKQEMVSEFLEAKQEVKQQAVN